MEINEYLIKSFELMRTLENIDFFAGVTNHHPFRGLADRDENGAARDRQSRCVSHGQKDRLYLSFGAVNGCL